MTNTPKAIKVLIVTLYSGENEYEQCCSSVLSQVGLEVTHAVIKNLPNQEAHQKLYKLFNDSRADFDYLAKLDADMYFSGPQSLTSIISNFNDNIDVVSASVHDGITNSYMQGFNVFSNRCYFHYKDNDPLFTDKLKIDYPGTHFSYTDFDRNVLHAYNPSPFQAFMFGVHRALKVVQVENKRPSFSNAFHHKRILNLAYINKIENNSIHAQYALLGATLVFNGSVKTSNLYDKKGYLDVFNAVNSIAHYEIDSRLKRVGFISLMKVIGIKQFTLGAFFWIKDKFKL